ITIHTELTETTEIISFTLCALWSLCGSLLCGPPRGLALEIPLERFLLPKGLIDQVRHGGGAVSNPRVLDWRGPRANGVEEARQVDHHRILSPLVPDLAIFFHVRFPRGRRLARLHLRVGVVRL